MKRTLKYSILASLGAVTLLNAYVAKAEEATPTVPSSEVSTSITVNSNEASSTTDSTTGTSTSTTSESETIPSSSAETPPVNAGTSTEGMVANQETSTALHIALQGSDLNAKIKVTAQLDWRPENLSGEVVIKNSQGNVLNTRKLSNFMGGIDSNLVVQYGSNINVSGYQDGTYSVVATATDKNGLVFKGESSFEVKSGKFQIISSKADPYKILPIKVEVGKGPFGYSGSGEFAHITGTIESNPSNLRGVMEVTDSQGNFLRSGALYREKAGLGMYFVNNGRSDFKLTDYPDGTYYVRVTAQTENHRNNQLYEGKTSFEVKDGKLVLSTVETVPTPQPTETNETGSSSIDKVDSNSTEIPTSPSTESTETDSSSIDKVDSNSTETSTSSSTESTAPSSTETDNNELDSSNTTGTTDQESSWIHYRSYYDLLNKKEILPATKDSGKWAGIPEISGFIYVSVFGDGSNGQASFVYYYVPEGTDLSTVKKLLVENNLTQQAVSNLDKLFPTKQEQPSAEGQGTSSTKQEQLSEEGKGTSSTKQAAEKPQTTTKSKKTLPTTGEVASLLSLVGLVGLSAVVLAHPSRKK
ncbi:TPA: hypothetical protein UDO34_000326 [Streptococcus suis]|nr:hypothetical protein [Streptococcus suis]